MFTAAIANAFEELVTRRVEYPDKGPSGEVFAFDILPHDTPAYLDAIAALGIVPRSLEERKKASQKESMDAFQGLIAAAQGTAQERNGSEGERQAKVAAERQTRKELDREEIISARFQYELYPVGYTVVEAAEAACAVFGHLVKRVVCIRDDEEEEVIHAQAEAWFTSTALIPRAIPEEGDAVRLLYMGGYPEGAAVALAILREAVQEHKFRERIVPLSMASGSTKAPKATTQPQPASETA